jgi:hypothetical protein
MHGETEEGNRNVGDANQDGPGEHRAEANRQVTARIVVDWDGVSRSRRAAHAVPGARRGRGCNSCPGFSRLSHWEIPLVSAGLPQSPRSCRCGRAAPARGGPHPPCGRLLQRRTAGVEQDSPSGAYSFSNPCCTRVWRRWRTAPPAPAALAGRGASAASVRGGRPGNACATTADPGLCGCPAGLGGCA